MRVAVLGAGAVGCYYGGMLARAGHAVTLIGRSLHVDAVRRDGLCFDSPPFQAHLPMQASTEASALHAAQGVLCCVKSTDTAQAAADLAAHLGRQAWVLSLQNGLDNAERLQSALSQPVAPAVVYVASAMAGPGHVRHHGGGELVLGTSERAAAALFEGAGVPVRTVDDITGALWVKLVLNCAYNALSAIPQLPYGRLVRGEGVLAVMREVVDECAAVAQASGVALPADLWDTVQRLAQAMPGQLSSTAQDLARGRRSEIDHLNGEVVRRGAALGVATPVNHVLSTLVKLRQDPPPP